MRCPGLPALAAAEPPREWIDPDTGHRVVRLSDEPGTASLYFNQNAYRPTGEKIVVTTHHGISTIELATRKIDPWSRGEVRVIVVGRKSGDVYYSKLQEGKSWIFATNLDTKATRRIAVLPRGESRRVNADETRWPARCWTGRSRLAEGGAPEGAAKRTDMANRRRGGRRPRVAPSGCSGDTRQPRRPADGVCGGQGTAAA